MLQLEYEIKLDEYNNPYTQLSKYYEEIPEDKFMILDLSTRMINAALLDSNFKSSLKEDQLQAIEICRNVLFQFRSEIASLMKQKMMESGNNVLSQEKNYNIEVTTIVKRNALNPNGIIYEDKIYKREIGLRVLVLETMKVYELRGGIENENWVEVK